MCLGQLAKSMTAYTNLTRLTKASVRAGSLFHICHLRVGQRWAHLIRRSGRRCVFDGLVKFDSS